MIKTADLTPRQKKIAIILLASILIYCLFGFLGAPFIVSSILEKQVAAAINRQVAVGAVRVNPITLSVTLRDLEVRENDGAPFVRLDEAYANLQTASLFKWALVLKSIRVDNPQVTIVRTGPAAFNFSDMAKGPAPETTTAEPKADNGGLALAIYQASISGARISLDDRVVAVAHQIDNLNVAVTDFSSRPADVDVFTLFSLDARINGADFSLKGKTRPFEAARETRVEVDFKSLQVPHYLPYVPLPENLRIPSMALDADTEIEFRILASGKPELVVAGLVGVSDARVADGSGDPIVYHPNLTFDLLPSRVLTGELRFAEVTASSPEYFLKRLPTGALYLPFLAVSAYDQAAVKVDEDPMGAFQPIVTIDTLIFDDGTVHYTDLSNSDPFDTTISDLDIEVNNFGLNSDRTAVYQLSLKTEAEESLRLSGTAALEPIKVSGEIDVSDVQVSRYVPYYKDIFDFKTIDGRLSFGGSYRFRQEADAPRVSLAGVRLDLRSLKVVDEDDDDPLIAIDRLRVADTTADLDRREVTVGSLAIADAQLSVRREKDGVLNLIKAFLPPSGSTPAEPEAASAAVADASSSAPPQNQPVVANLKRLEVSGVSVDVEDRVPAEPFKLRLDEIRLSADNLSTRSGSAGRAELSLRWEQGGEIQLGGDLSLVPLDLQMNVAAKKIDIRPLQPYLSEQAGLIVTQGFFSTEGRMGLSQPPASEPTLSYAGKVGLSRFASIDRQNANDFLKWEALTLDDVEVGVNPTRLSIDQVSLADFFARVIVYADGSVNLVSMFANPEGKANPREDSTTTPEKKGERSAPTPTSVEKPPVRIARVTLSGGDVDFSDRLIKPNFNAKFHDLAGRISGLESIAEKRADVLLEGMWSNHAPVKITGQINPLIDDPYVDLNLNIADIELSPFSPYSGKYLGYIIEKGKLTFDVAYLMENRKLEGRNSVYVNQFTLGDTVDSEDKVGLPIKLAVALLKDREGNIELDLPVSGDMDDPEFKIGKVILTVLKNLIVKIVTSPFAALGALAGGGEELSYLDFEAGVSDISPENAEKMDQLGTILFERPGLSLDIQGTAGAQWDQEALRVVLMENRLKSEKLERMVKAGERAVQLDEVIISDEERSQLVAAVFEVSDITVPVDDSGKPVELTPETMETLLRTHTQVTKDDFRNLANRRALNAKDYLLESGEVERERVFIVAPEILMEDQAPEETGSGQVVFSLK